MNRKKLNGKILNGIIYLVLFLALLLTLLPIGWVFSTSMKKGSEIFAKPPRWIPLSPTLENYKDVLFGSSIPNAFKNSFLVGIMTTFAALLLGGSAGYAFARFKFRGNRLLSLFMLISQMLPLTVLMIPMYYMENAVGMVDTKIGLAAAHLVIDRKSVV